MDSVLCSLFEENKNKTQIECKGQKKVLAVMYSRNLIADGMLIENGSVP